MEANQQAEQGHGSDGVASPLVIDEIAREVRVDGVPVHLTRTEFDLLAVLARFPRRALSREQLISEVWGGSWFGDNHMITVHISNLRRKIGDGDRQPPLIRTLHGVGYRFDGDSHNGNGERPNGQARGGDGGPGSAGAPPLA